MALPDPPARALPGGGAALDPPAGRRARRRDPRPRRRSRRGHAVHRRALRRPLPRAPAPSAGINVLRNLAIDATDADSSSTSTTTSRPAQFQALRAAADCPEDVGAFAGPIHVRIEDHRYPTCSREGPPIRARPGASAASARTSPCAAALCGTRRSASTSTAATRRMWEALAGVRRARRCASPPRAPPRGSTPATATSRAARTCAAGRAPLRRQRHRAVAAGARIAGARRVRRPRPAAALLQRRDDDRPQPRAAAQRAHRRGRAPTTSCPARAGRWRRTPRGTFLGDAWLDARELLSGRRLHPRAAARARAGASSRWASSAPAWSWTPRAELGAAGTTSAS